MLLLVRDPPQERGMERAEYRLSHSTRNLRQGEIFSLEIVVTH